MKKIIFMAMSVIALISLGGCGADIKTSISKNISDIRYDVFIGQTENVRASLMCGMRENPYHYDGVSNKTCEFGIISVSLKEKNNYEALNYTLKIDDYEITGALEENPYDHTFMTDIERLVSAETSLYLTIDGVVDNMLLLCESESWQVKYQDALDIAFNCVEEDALMFMEKNKFKAECYLKIIFDMNSEKEPYYWYFGVVGQNGKNISVIIDPKTGAVVAKNIS